MSHFETRFCRGHQAVFFHLSRSLYMLVTQRQSHKFFFLRRSSACSWRSEHHGDNGVRWYEVWTAFESVTWVASPNVKIVARCQFTQSSFLPGLLRIPYHGETSAVAVRSRTSSLCDCSHLLSSYLSVAKQRFAVHVRWSRYVTPTPLQLVFRTCSFSSCCVGFAVHFLWLTRKWCLRAETVFSVVVPALLSLVSCPFPHPRMDLEVWCGPWWRLAISTKKWATPLCPFMLLHSLCFRGSREARLCTPMLL